MRPYSKAAEFVTEHLKLEKQIVGVKILPTEEAFHAFAAPETDRIMPYCVFVKEASQGQAYKITKDNQACEDGARALHLLDVSEKVKSGAHFKELGAYDSEQTAKHALSQMDYLTEAIYGVGLKPIEEFQSEPDVVIFFLTPLQAMHLVQAVEYSRGEFENFNLLGIQGVCHELTSKVYETGKMNGSVLCSGCRMNCGFSECEMGVGLPFKDWNRLVQNKETLTTSAEEELV